MDPELVEQYIVLMKKYNVHTMQIETEEGNKLIIGGFGFEPPDIPPLIKEQAGEDDDPFKDLR